MFDLGGMLGGGPAPEAQKDSTDGWTAWLQDPRNQAFMLNAGLQLMMPSWGGGAAPLAEAFAAGAQGYQGVDKLQRDKQEKDAAISRDEARHEDTQTFTAEQNDLNRANQRDIANINATSREKLLSTRLSASSGAGALSKDERRAALAATNAEKKAIDNYNLLHADAPIEADEEQVRLDRVYAEAIARVRRGGSAAVTSQNSAPAATGQVPNGVETPTETPEITSGNSTKTPNDLGPNRAIAPGRSGAPSKLLTREQLLDPRMQDPRYKAAMRKLGYGNVPE